MAKSHSLILTERVHCCNRQIRTICALSFSLSTAYNGLLKDSEHVYERLRGRSQALCATGRFFLEALASQVEPPSDSTLPGVTPACEAAARRASRLEAFSEALPN